MSGILKKIRYQKYIEEKKRLLLLLVFLLIILFSSGYLFKMAYARYEAKSRLNGNIEKALYIFGDDHYNIHLFPEGITPRKEAYTYKFSISNFNEKKVSDVDISYNIKIRTTTNLPITLELYRNEEYSTTATNLLGGAKITRDSDGAWYKEFKLPEDYQMSYENKITDIYTLVIKFPDIYSIDMTYANYVENIELTLNSKQVVS